jgi:hypothetical protein
MFHGAVIVQAGLAEFLVKSILDIEFRERALSDPDGAFEGFDLSADEKDVLSSGDERLLNLLGRGLQYSGPAQHNQQPMGESSSEPSVFPHQTLPEINLRMRLVPHAVRSPDNLLELSYSASLHPWTDDPATWDQPVGGATDPESVAAAIDLMIRVVPTVISLPGSEPKLAYSASIQSPNVEVGTVVLPGEGKSFDGTALPSRYHGDSLAARQAAAEIGQAEPDQRYPTLLELVSALRHGDADV